MRPLPFTSRTPHGTHSTPPAAGGSARTAAAKAAEQHGGPAPAHLHMRAAVLTVSP